MRCKIPAFLLLAALLPAPAQVQSTIAESFWSRDILVDPVIGELTDNRWIAPVVGVSKGFGEMAGLSLVYSGATLYGGVGKDWILHGDNHDKLLWHAGLGYTFSFHDSYDAPHSSASLGVTFSENSHYLNHALTLDGRYWRWVGTARKWGVYAGVGIGIAGITAHSHVEFAWNVEIGAAVQIRLCTKGQYETYNKSWIY